MAGQTKEKVVVLCALMTKSIISINALRVTFETRVSAGITAARLVMGHFCVQAIERGNSQS
jgi:hypothetical protein